MLEEIIVPLLLCQVQGKLSGKTRLQKLMFLIQNEASAEGVTGSNFHYELYHYGPYSSELSALLDNLKNEGFLNESTEMTPSGYTRYVYALTDRGRRMIYEAREKKLIAEELEEIVARTISSFGGLPLEELVNEAYRRYSH